jgi:hypothetical protein
MSAAMPLAELPRPCCSTGAPPLAAVCWHAAHLHSQTTAEYVIFLMLCSGSAKKDMG